MLPQHHTEQGYQANRWHDGRMARGQDGQAVTCPNHSQGPAFTYTAVTLCPKDWARYHNLPATVSASDLVSRARYHATKAMASHSQGPAFTYTAVTLCPKDWARYRQRRTGQPGRHGAEGRDPTYRMLKGPLGTIVCTRCVTMRPTRPSECQKVRPSLSRKYRTPKW